MSLITCPECKNQISDQAQLCPLCGFPIQQHLAENPLPNKRRETLLGILGLIFIFAVAGYFIVPYFTETTPRDHEVIMPSDTLNTDYDDTPLPEPEVTREAKPTAPAAADSAATPQAASPNRDSASQKPVHTPAAPEAPAPAPTTDNTIHQ